MSRIADTQFHRSPEQVYKAFHRFIEEAVHSQKISLKEKSLIELFISEISTLHHISAHRKYAILTALVKFKDYIQDYSTCTTQDIFISIEHYRTMSGHSPANQNMTLGIYKRFLLWLCESEYNTTLNPTKISKLSLKKPAPLKTAEDILTPQELEALYDATKTPRDRALLEVLYESMGRIGEVAMLKWGSLTFHDNYITVALESKTDYPRKVPLHTSQIALKRWMDYYPIEITPEKYIFLIARSEGKKPLTYDGVRWMLQNVRKNAGITKRVTPHIFRHTRITDLMRMGVPEQTIKMLAWGTVTTDMLRVYAHLTPTDAENDLNRIMGIDTKNEKPALADITTPIQCTGCGVINPKSNRFCGECGMPLAKEDNDYYNQIVKIMQTGDISKEVAQFILTKMKKET